MLKIAMHSQSRLSGGPASFFSNLRAEINENGLAKIVKSWNPTQDIGLYSSIAKQLFSFPYVLRIDGIYFDKRNTFGENSFLNRKIFSSISNSSGIIFQSEFSRRLVQAHYGKVQHPQIVILNGAKIQNHKHKKNLGNSKIIVCSANWRPNKRLEDIIKAIAMLRKNIECELFILGDVGKNLIPESNYIHVLGPQPRSVVSDYLSKADLFIHLSWLDPCPNSVVEAISHGVPVVCSNQGGTPEIVRNANAGRVSDCDENVAYEKLVDLHNPPQPDIKQIVRDTELILENHTNIVDGINYSAVDIRIAALKYISFCRSILGEKG